MPPTARTIIEYLPRLAQTVRFDLPDRDLPLAHCVHIIGPVKLLAFLPISGHCMRDGSPQHDVFNRELATRDIVKKEQLLLLLEATSVDQAVRGGIRDDLERDFR